MMLAELTRDAADLSVQPVTVLDQAVERIRTNIMIGTFRPGEKLAEIELSQRMRISRPTLREAFRRLEAERLVNVIPNRGAFVAELGPEHVRNIHHVWAMLTGEAVRLFVARFTDEDDAALARSLGKIEELIDSDDTAAYLQATNRMFGVVLARCGNDILAETIRSLVSRINFLRAQSMRIEGRRRACTAELQSLVAAMTRRDPELAKAAAQAHIDAACEAAMRALSATAAPHGNERPHLKPARAS